MRAETGIKVSTLFGLMILARQCNMSSDKFLDNLLYQNPCLINLSVSNLCLITKLWNVSHILLILMSCEMYTRYVGFAGILLDI